LFIVAVSSALAEHKLGMSKTDSKVHWTDEVVKLLTETYSSCQHDIEKPKSCQIKVWNKIAAEMTSTHQA